MGQKVSICSTQNLKGRHPSANMLDDNNQYSSEDENHTAKGSQFRKAGVMKPLPNPNRKLGGNSSSKNQYDKHGNLILESQGSASNGIGQHFHTQGSSAGSLTPTPTTPTSSTHHQQHQPANNTKKLMGGRIGGAKMDKKLTKSFYKEDGQQQQQSQKSQQNKNTNQKNNAKNASQIDSQSIFKTTDSANNDESQDYMYDMALKNLLPPCGDYQKHIDSLRKQKAMKIRITWNYGGNEVYIIGSFTSWEYIIKMHKNQLGITPVFEISMYVKEGQYYYYFIVDGKVRFAPDQPSTIDRNQRIVNYIEIDKYMIQRAENEREHKVKNMMDCLATENSWCLSENFERDCKERCQLQIEDDINFSIDIVTHSDDEKKNACNACESSKSNMPSRNASQVTSPHGNMINQNYFNSHQSDNQKENTNSQNLPTSPRETQQSSKKNGAQTTTHAASRNRSTIITKTNNNNNDNVSVKKGSPSKANSQLNLNTTIMGLTAEKKCAQKFIKFCPSSSYMEKESLQEISQLADVYN